MTKILDADRYDESHTITIKVPISIPYVNDQTDFVRVDGKFEHQGEFYRTVKQKYANDTLTVVCIKDLVDKKINQALSSYVKTFTDNTTNQNQNSKITISFIKDYLPQTFSLRSISCGWETDVIKQTVYGTLISSFVPSIQHPPERG